MIQIKKIEALAQQCAKAAHEAAGSVPYNVDGETLLPDYPQEGDWEALDVLHEVEGCGEPKLASKYAFATYYKRTMQEIAAEYWEPNP